ncbi:MAG: 30S ribosomal protein S19e [Haloarculaceae archaeon]
MTSLYDVPAEALIEAVAEKLADDVQEPDWVQFTKTGPGRELPPEQEDFWQVRAASLLRKVAVNGPVGVDRLETAYGSPKQGSTRYRVRPARQSNGSGKIIRTILQQLEEADYIQTREGQGRDIAPDGQALLDNTAADLIEDFDRPELERYA